MIRRRDRTSAAPAWRRWLRELALELVILIGAIAIAALAAGAGAKHLTRARDLAARIPDRARFYAVVPAAHVAGVRTDLTRAAAISMSVVGEHSVAALLGQEAPAEAESERLRVLELAVPLAGSPDLLAITGALRSNPWIVDVVDLNARERRAVTPAHVQGEHLVGAGWLGASLALLFAGVLAAARAGARNRSAEIATRQMLGADAARLWLPLALPLSCTAGLAALVLSIGSGVALGVPMAWACMLALGACLIAFAMAFVASRSAVLRRAHGATAIGLAILLSSGLAAPSGADAAKPQAPATRPEWRQVQRLGRELAASRRTMHAAMRDLAEAERLAVLALASESPELRVIAGAERAEGARVVSRWRSVCAALRIEIDRMRERLRARQIARVQIEPRTMPVRGAVAVGFGEAGRRPGTAAFRNGVALRARESETVRAVAPGHVAFVGKMGGAGEVVIVDHGQRTYSVYARIGEALVERGAAVESGAPVARAGEAGLIYFSVRREGRALDPLEWVAGRTEANG